VASRGRSVPAPVPSSPVPADGTPLDALSQLVANAVAARSNGYRTSPYELPVVVACRGLIADTLAQLPLVAVKHRRPVEHQPPVFMRPDPMEPYGVTMTRIANALTGPAGHCWLLPTATDAAGWATAVQVLTAAEVSPTFDASGRLATVDYRGRKLRPGLDVVWIAGDVAERGDLGVSPLERCRRAVDYLCALYDMAGSFWEAGFPSVAIEVPHRLNAVQAAELKQRVVAGWARRHEPVVVDSDANIKQVGSNAVEADLVRSIEVANCEIARAMRVVPSLLGLPSGDSLTYATQEGEFRKWLAVGLGGYLWRVEAAFSDLRPHGTAARFDTLELQRADHAARYAAWATALGGAPFMTVDEVRAVEGLGPLSAPLSGPSVSPESQAGLF